VIKALSLPSSTYKKRAFTTGCNFSWKRSTTTVATTNLEAFRESSTTNKRGELDPN